MQTISATQKLIEPLPAKTLNRNHNLRLDYKPSALMVHGRYMQIVKTVLWINILLLTFYHYKNPITAFKALKQLKKMRTDFRGKYPVIKYAKNR